MPLTDPAIRNAKPRERPYKLGDAGGCSCSLPRPGLSGGASSTASGGKQSCCHSGVYPQVSLKEARAKRDEARKQLAAVVDPSAARKAAKAARGGEDSFEAIAREWHGKHAPRGTTYSPACAPPPGR
jgi:hypothetical protein